MKDFSSDVTTQYKYFCFSRCWIPTYTFFFLWLDSPSGPRPVLHHLCTKNFDGKKLDMLTNCQQEFITFIKNLNNKYIHSQPPNTAKYFSF